jgi:hypothetical protein
MSGAQSPHIYDTDFEEVADQRCGADRRRAPRRLAKQHLDTLFATTLVNHLNAPERVCNPGYRRPSKLRPGIAFDLRA